MLRILCLLLVLTGSSVFAQTIVKPSSILVSSFALENDEYIQANLDKLISETINLPGSIGLIILYGTEKDISKREVFIKNQIIFRRYDKSRLTFINGGFIKTAKTEFWLIPQGAEIPKIEPKPHLIDEFGNIDKKNFLVRMNNLTDRLRQDRAGNGVIVIDGPPRESKKYEKYILDSIKFRTFDPVRLKIIRGNPSKIVKITLWFIPSDLDAKDLNLNG